MPVRSSAKALTSGTCRQFPVTGGDPQLAEASWALSMPVTVALACQGGIGQESEGPPPPAPPPWPSFHTFCWDGSVGVVPAVVPPTPTTSGWLAGSFTDG